MRFVNQVRHWNSRTQSEKFPDAYEQRRICSFSGMYVCKPRPPQLHITDKGNVWCCLPERKPTEREVAEKAATELTHWRKLGEEHTCALPKDRDRRVCVHSLDGFWSLAYTDTNLQNEPVPCPCNRCDEFHKRGKLLPCIPCFHEAAWHGATSHLEAAEKEAMYKAADLEELRMVCITIMIICDDNNILRAYDKGHAAKEFSAYRSAILFYNEQGELKPRFKTFDNSEDMSYSIF